MKPILSLVTLAFTSYAAAQDGMLSVSISLLAKTSISVELDAGCSCDADCKGRYSYDTVCEHNICVKDTVQPTTTPCTTSTHVTIAPTSRTTNALIVGCTCDADCNGRYPYDTVCENAVCVNVEPTSRTTMTTTTTAACTTSSPKVLPTSRTTMENIVGCTCDADCQGRYPYDTVCEHNICVMSISPGGAIATERAPEEARSRMPGPESAGNRFFLAAEAGMDLSGYLVDLVDGKLVAVD